MTITTRTPIQLEYGKFTVCFHRTKHGECLSFSHGNLKKKIPIVRIHSACLFGEAFHSKCCDCGEQLDQTLKLIKKNGSGTVVYGFDEGRGAGIENKIRAMNLEQKHKIDSAEAYEQLNLKVDERRFLAEAEALKELKPNKKIKIVSGNPNKMQKLVSVGFTITNSVKLKIRQNRYSQSEFKRKKKRGYLY